MQQQLFVGTIAPNEYFFIPVKNGSMNKPQGGFWTSTYIDKKNGSDWVQWCLGAEFRVPVNSLWKSWLLTPSKNARVFTIDNFEDLLKLLEEHEAPPLVPNIGHMFAQLDYEKLSNSFDAIHLSQEGQWATRFSSPSLYGWDCESTVWLNFKWCFEKIEYLGEVKYTFGD